ncbi:aliphatic sulfonate ABC transporter substrate-binding protein [Pseudomonas saudiphocaensis]|uniref:aliphatic sulfonate ABC transporter substrate-binding protein n=1 Tax=Pseudomonas saudiphocaensis TaxID=1499686 RepID=UPI000F77D16D|nr:aliphatic sulfonate ABC transporter substrate-binding protein [Pseudomonas saudiphocaensis]RRV16512.1 aliphatic sulfonate ABC transporter substrate-binding protein [Pseudomonas saudiphocaensis]
MSITRKPRNALLSLFLATGLLGAPLVEAATQLRIGYQKSSTLISLLKVKGTLESALAPHDVKISWHEFPNGQPLLEALNVGNIDLSADVADTVPVFAQAAGARLAYFATEAPSPTAQAIIVHQDSPLSSVAELKGKKVAVTRAAGNHYLLLSALADAGLKFGDIDAAYLAPADGRAAFENRKVDAWVAWEPFLSSAQQQLPTRTLADGTGLADYQRYYLTSAAFAEAHPQVLQSVFNELVKAGEWLRTHPREAAEQLGPLWGNLAPQIVEQANQRRSYDVRAVKPESLVEQQKIADAFFNEGLLPERIDASDVVLWKPEVAQ